MSDREETFLEMVQDNEARIRRLCRVYESEPEGRKDLYQEILLQLWRSVPSYQGEANPGTWLYRVALNTALGRERRRRVRSEATLDEENPLRKRGFPRPDERLEADRRLERLHAEIDRLDEVDRAIVLLYLEERSYREMAEVLGISRSHVGVKLHRIKKKLANRMAEES